MFFASSKNVLRCKCSVVVVGNSGILYLRRVPIEGSSQVRRSRAHPYPRNGRKGKFPSQPACCELPRVLYPVCAYKVFPSPSEVNNRKPKTPELEV